jgi:putative effector of murein hydrolase LrgA (UPF0299 family)
LLLAAGLLMSSAIALGSYASSGVLANGGPWPGVAVVAVLNQVLFVQPIVITLVLVPLVFPDGRLPSPRWAWIVVVTVLAMAALVTATIVTPATLIAGIENPFAVRGLVPLADALNADASITAFIAFGGALASIVVRFCRGDPVERQQLKWLLAAAGLAALTFPMSTLVSELGGSQEVADLLFLLTLLAFIGLPITIGIAGLQAVFAEFVGDNTLAVAASTLVVAALFAPVRSRVQRFVDRRFDRARYPARGRTDMDRASLLTIVAGHFLQPVSEIAIDASWAGMRQRPRVQGHPAPSAGR